MKSKIGIVLTLLTLFELTFTSQVVLAANEITRLVPFQGRLHGGDNKIVADGVYDLAFNVYDTPTGGTAIWTETHPKVSVIHGYVNILLGGINPMVASNFSSQAPLYDESKNVVNFAQEKYLGISINGGTEMFPRSQLVPSFHAFTANHANHATNSDNLGGLSADSYATLSHSNAADAVLDAKIDSEISGISGDTDANFNSKFIGNKARDANLLDGKDYTWFLPKTGKAVDADKLDGLNSTSFLRSTATAVNADKLDNLNSTDFLRSGAKAVDSNLLDGKDSTAFSQAYRNTYFGNNDSNITTAAFITLLNAKGAFSVPHWVSKGAWSYSGNQNITDTGIISSLELAGAVVEVFSNGSTTYTVRVTGAPAGNAAHRVFEYINHGSSYTPGWKEITTNRAGKAYDANLLDGIDSRGFMKSTKDSNNFYGLTDSGGSTSNWIRTTTNGLLPATSGSASSLGTTSWNFQNIYGTNIYDGNVLLENKYLAKTSHQDLVPVGTVLMWPGTGALPTGYLACDGATFNNSMYPELRALIGTTYGGNSTQFSLPNYQGLFLRGWGKTGAGNTNDPDGNTRTIAQVQGSDNKSHDHSYSWTEGRNYRTNRIQMRQSDNHMNGEIVAGRTTLKSGGTESRPKNIGIRYIIKAKSH